ncbi:MAG: lactonase family protein [Akkermansiaceae bacterium]
MRNLLCPLTALFALSSFGLAEKLNVFIGTGSKDAEGIYHCTFDTEKGKLSKPALAAEIERPGFLAFSPDGKFLYSLGKQGNADSVSAYAVNGAKLTLLNHEPIGDGGGAHIAVHPNGKFLVTAQYGGGSVAVFPIQADGKVGTRSQLIEHEGGSGVVAKRQDKPHPHWAGFSPDGKFAFVPDLGLDDIVIYKTTAEGKLTEHGRATTVPGGGPRHMRFSTNGKFIHLLDELSLSVTTFGYDAAAGTAKKLGTTPTLSEEVKAKENFNSCSEIVTHPSGKFLYVGNRGNDTVTALKADAQTGKTQVIEVEPIRGSWPRNINLTPSGKWLIAAGAHSNTLSVFSVDEKSGELTFIPRSPVTVPGPICIVFGK